jgi:uncharacterized membrane protein
MIPKNRLEALTDGVYAFAMTLLVIDLRLPESFNPKNDGQLLNALSELWSQLLVYAISFWVLGLRWLGQVQIDNHREKVGHGYGAWSLLGLFFVTCVPFSTMLVGRYGHVAPAVWVYAANMAAGSLIALRLQQLDAPQLTSAERASQRDPALAMIAAALISAAISLISPDHAMLGYLVTLAPVLLRRRQR